jgi:ABC-type transport system substrate-binding protein
VRVRKALQLSLDRQTLLDASYNGNGTIENGIFPVGLIGHNDDLEEIPYDPEKAKRLLKEAGYPDGIDLEFTLRSISTAWQVDLVDMMVEMWSRVGIRANITVATDEEFMEARTTGKTALYLATWAADYDDPDNFIYTFFGSRENTTNRSLGYPNEDVMRQVRDARAIVDEKERIKTYHKLEKKIVQEDAAWIPLFSRDRHYLVSERVKNFTWAWNGWDEPVFRDISIEAV